MWFVALFAGAVLLLTHLAPFPFLLDWANRDVAMWKVPQPAGGRAVYLTFDDGPNPAATPALLDVLARHKVEATFFVIDRHITPETAPIVARAAAEGHAIALHSHTRRLMALSPDALARTLDEADARLTRLTGVRPCPAFRPHGGGRSGDMMNGLRQSGRRLVGWGMFLWDWDWFRSRTAERLVPRIAAPRRSGLDHRPARRPPQEPTRRPALRHRNRGSADSARARERIGVRDDLRRYG